MAASSTCRLSDVVAALDAIAPPHLAENWDNVGLLVGDRSQFVSRAMLTVDYTPEVAIEAREAECDLVIAYHPPLFSPVKRVTADGSMALIFDAIRRGVAIYSPHTALDVADGGTNDVLADLIALTHRRPLRLREAKSTHHKLVTFVPVDAVAKVSDALFAAGAGTIGDYDRCSFRSPGTGTFRGNANTNPAVGTPGRFEETDEVRLEVLVEIGKAEAVVAALRKSHPYEEVAFDLQMLCAPQPAVGIGRIGSLPSDISLEMLANLLKRGLDVDRLLIAGDPERVVRTIALCAGAGGELLSDALARKVDVYLTGEVRHHDALRALRAGMSVICTLHSNSERVTLHRLADRLRADVADVEFLVSQVDRDPFTIA